MTDAPLPDSAQDPIPERLLTIRMVAELLVVHRRTVRRLVDRGLLACVTWGRSVRFRAEDVRSFVERHRQGPPPPGRVAESVATRATVPNAALGGWRPPK